MRYLRLVVPLLVAALFFTLLPRLLAADPDRSVVISDDRQTVQVQTARGNVAFEYTFGEWRAWAEASLVEALGGAVRIGEQTMPPSTFEGFGSAALSGSGERLALSVTTYALLTTVSVVGFLDPGSGEFSAVADPATGGVEQFHWSPNGEFLGYALSTARAEGDRLRIDDTGELSVALELGAEDLITVARGRGLEMPDVPRHWLPRIRQLEWAMEGVLRFTTDDFGSEEPEGELRWSADPHSGDVALE